VKLLQQFQLLVSDLYFEIKLSISFSGFNVETVEYKNISFTVWDVGGQVSPIKKKIFFIEFLFRIKFVHYGDIIFKILKVLFLLLIAMIENVLVKHVMNFNECFQKMNLEKLYCSFLLINKYNKKEFL
jgi:hypothetical protein